MQNQVDFSLKTYRADYFGAGGVTVAVDHFPARNIGQAVAFADKRAPGSALEFQITDGAGEVRGSWPVRGAAYVGLPDHYAKVFSAAPYGMRL